MGQDGKSPRERHQTSGSASGNRTGNRKIAIRGLRFPHRGVLIPIDIVFAESDFLETPYAKLCGATPEPGPPLSQSSTLAASRLQTPVDIST